MFRLKHSKDLPFINLFKMEGWKMFYKDLAVAANDLNQGDPSIENVLQKLCMRKVAGITLIGACFLQLEQTGELHLLYNYGLHPEEVGLSKSSIDIFEDHPAAIAARNGSLTFANHRNGKNGPKRNHSMIVWPLIADSRMLGTLILMADEQVIENDEFKECLEGLATIINGALSRSFLGQAKSKRNGAATKQNKPQQNLQTNNDLSERQMLILKLISEGRTNADIAEIIGYSESLIRQETIRIYSLLGCSGRNEATNLFHQMQNLDPDDAIPATTVSV